MPAPTEIIDLINRFKNQYDSYHSPSYNETQLRREFVDPFFKTLGWDVDNEQGYAEAYKDVIHEDSIKVGGATKAPDYAFRIGGVRKFFVETKKPAVNIQQDVSPAFQLRRYAWSAKLPLSILTDFEEFAVYDCRIRPEKNDKASKARTLYVTYKEYDAHWDEIVSIFSRDAILKGSFDKYAQSTKRKRGTAEVDDAFLGEIEQWRSDLARNLALRNPELSQRELNVAVQKTIDRIIFLRICEDRGIEQYGQLQSLLNGLKTYARMCELFRRADERYNSGLFHFSQEKDRAEPPDEWTLSLAIDDRVLKDIIRRLYYPESPYEFSVLGADILGQVYEQFLGKVIRLTKGHQAKVEDKPEVKKAGGVYYTPTYIVDCIVKQTVGKLLEGKQPHEVAARTKTTWKPSKRDRPLSVLDPACGSGSFLIGAYQYLLNWHRDWYVEHDPKKFKDRIYQMRADEWRLTTAERKRILLDHIHGVDIDPQAVEVTKLSLLLKVLEGENQESLQRQLRLFRERALPDLADNIKCGNSLIGLDFYKGKLLDLFDEEERLRINVFDWQTEFSEIMQSGGFDAVIGNPPYITYHGRRRILIPNEMKTYFRTLYECVLDKGIDGKYNSAMFFIERMVSLCATNGRIGVITDISFYEHFYDGVKKYLLDRTQVNAIVNGLSSFLGVGSGQVIIIATKSAPSENGGDTLWYSNGIDGTTTIVDQRIWDEASKCYQFFLPSGARREAIIAKCREHATPLGELFPNKLIRTGESVGVKEAGFVIEESQRNGSVVEYDYLEGSKSIARRYAVPRPTRWFRFDLPLLKQRNVEYRKAAERQNQKNPKVLGIGDKKAFDNPKVLIRQSCDHLCATYTERKFVYNRSFYSISNENSSGRSDVNLLFILGIFNSKLLTFYSRHERVIRMEHGKQPQIRLKDLKNLPITTGAMERQRVASLAIWILSLHQRLSSAKTTLEKTQFQRQIEATDREIDHLVFELYGLSDEEIRIVEEATAR